MNLEQQTLDQIAKDFPEVERAGVVELLSSYSGPERGRVAWDILVLSKGNVEDVRLYVKVAQTDYRDVLYWAEYYNKDTMLQGRDPKKLVKDILDKWSDKK